MVVMRCKRPIGSLECTPSWHFAMQVLVRRLPACQPIECAIFIDRSIYEQLQAPATRRRRTQAQSCGPRAPEALREAR